MNERSRTNTVVHAEISIVIVDDDEDDYILVRDLLQEIDRVKYRLDWIEKYDDAVNAIQTQTYDVYLIDYRLGEHDGLDLLRRIKEEGLLSPVILLTGTHNEEVDVLASEIGAADYLVKRDLTAPLLERSIRYAIRNAELATELHERASTDALTGLFNRGEMTRILGQETQRERRYGAPLSLLMIDIDHFKQVNDKFGHQVGDAALKWVAAHISRGIRPTDHAVRYGGEEMLVIAPQLSEGVAHTLAERLRRSIAAEPFLFEVEDRSQMQIPITVSIGVATMPTHAKSGETLIAAADRALYEAKENGRNCTVSSAFSSKPSELENYGQPLSARGEVG